MFGAIYIGLSGLNAYSQGLKQVSNNVTNLNTAGFKGSTVSFQNYYGGGDTGGLAFNANSQGSGNGVGSADQRLSFKQGELRQTDADLDLAVDGTGFLVLMRGDEIAYTRTGSFQVDKDGFIVLSGTDYRLATLDASGRPVSLSIDSKRNSAPMETGRMKLSGNLSADATTFTLPDVKVYDSRGAEHVWTFKFDRPATGTVWTVSVTDSKGGSIPSKTLTFIGNAVDPQMSRLTFVWSDTNPDTPDMSVRVNFAETTSYVGGSVSTLKVSSVAGYGAGVLTTVSVNKEGELELAYSNEQKVSLGAIALGDFRDPQSLEQKSGGLFAYSGTGEMAYLASKDSRVGQVLGKRIEASNVDLSKEFGDLILIQRGFQASSQIISVSNDMIQQLFGIRGQG